MEAAGLAFGAQALDQGNSRLYRWAQVLVAFRDAFRGAWPGGVAPATMSDRVFLSPLNRTGSLAVR